LNRYVVRNFINKNSVKLKISNGLGNESFE
jgi:hypothetical protein